MSVCHWGVDSWSTLFNPPSFSFNKMSNLKMSEWIPNKQTCNSSWCLIYHTISTNAKLALCSKHFETLIITIFESLISYNSASMSDIKRNIFKVHSFAHQSCWKQQYRERVDTCMAVVTPVTEPANRRRAFAQADNNQPIRRRHRGGAGYRTWPTKRQKTNTNTKTNSMTNTKTFAVCTGGQ